MNTKNKWALKGDIIALDIETVRAVYGEKPEALCVCLYIPAERYTWTSTGWGPDCIVQAETELARLRKSRKAPYLIIAHNGGKFDFGYFKQDEGAKRLVGSRLLQTSICGIPALDTMLLMPAALKQLGSKWETNLADHRLDADLFAQQTIKLYCANDCKVLADAYMRFAKVFTGVETDHPKATAASNAFSELKKTLPGSHQSLWKTTGVYDARIRPYYHGGIVNTFGQARDIEGEFLMIDANSMYPGVMMNMDHPASNQFIEIVNPKIDRRGKLVGFRDTFFLIHFTGRAKLMPHVKPTGGLEYDVEGEYWVTSHELQASMRYGFARIDKVHEVLLFKETCRFGEFVDTFYNARMECKARKDPVEIVYKIILNSAYGKFGMDPRNYGEHATTFTKEPPENTEGYEPWQYVGASPLGDTYYWERQKILDPEDQDFINVATAASITGGARATLIDAIGGIVQAGGTVHYTDTDSVTFEGGIAGLKLGKKLGEWKVEAECDRLVIAGPKLYAMRQKDGKWKMASKGVRAKPEQIIDLVANKEDLEYFPEVGSHDWRSTYRTQKRKIRRENLGIK